MGWVTNVRETFAHQLAGTHIMYYGNGQSQVLKMTFSKNDFYLSQIHINYVSITFYYHVFGAANQLFADCFYVLNSAWLHV